ncbi:hypothetical protein IAT40_000250 [Kwoniella sp. CBS 6097]
MPASEVSEQEIEREINTLRNLRRRSITSAGPGALPLDPDLPPPSPGQRSPYSPDSNFSYSSNDDVTLSTPDGLDGDDGMFWVPAHLHPELAPGEFRAFLKSHTHPDPTSADAAEAAEAPGLSRSPSWLARNPSRRGTEGLGRKRSMLSRQYQPRAGDNVEEERPPLPSRRPASIYGGRSGEKGLTLNDLQKLEEIVDEVDEVDDPAKMRQLLRRSLSTNVAPGLLQDDVPLGADGGDAPIIPPRPGSILRRSAHTKIRKAGLAGDGGGHRFAATRKGRMTAAPQPEIPTFDDEFDHSDRQPKGSTGSDENVSTESHEEKETFHDSVQHLEERRDSDASTDEALIFEAYARDSSRSSSVSSSSHDHSTSPSPESSPPGKKLSLPPVITTTPYQADSSDWFASADHDRTPTQESVADPLGGVRRPSPGAEIQLERPAVPSLSTAGPNLAVPDDGYSSQPTSPTTPQQRASALPQTQSQYDLPPGMAPPAQRSVIPPGIAMQQEQQQQQQQTSQTQPKMTPVNIEQPNLGRTDSRTSVASSSTSTSTGKEKEKEKQKKGGLFGKKDKKDKEKDGKSKKDKDRFLGSLFGGKKKQEEISAVASFSSAGPAAAAALLGASKSAKSLGVPPSPSPTSPGFSSFARYPIHVERAVYRLSHIKLANARRPLYEQVLISNLMFWYLGVIGRNVSEEKKTGSTNGEEKKEEVKAPAKGTPPKPADSGSAGNPLPRTSPSPRSTPVAIESPAPTPAPSVAPSGKKTSLSKPERARDGRNSEAPMRAPQYGMQNAQVDHELRGGAPSKQSPPPPRQQPQHPNPPHQQAGYNPTNGSPHPRPIPQNQPQRAMSQPPPGAGPGPRANTENYHHVNVQGPARGVPQSSFGPPPPSGQPHQHPQPILTGLDERRDTRQRTLSNPTHPGHPQGPHQGSGPGPNTAGMRRVVTDGRPGGPEGPSQGPQPRPLYPQHSGPQPGQIFQHPNAGGTNGPASPFPPRPSPGSGPQPGQIFSHNQPGQIFHHPQQRPPPGSPGYGQRPLPPPGGAPPAGWEPPQRLPPGAGPPQQGWRPPPGQAGPPQGYDPRRTTSPPNGPIPYSPQQAFYGGPPPQQRPPAQPQVGQVYNAYSGGGGYGHHR